MDNFPNVKTGLEKNISAALSYLAGPITGLVFLIIEKDPFVRFHALQSTVVFTVFLVIKRIVSFLGYLFVGVSKGILPVSFFISNAFAFLQGFLSLVMFLTWLVCIYKAWNNERWQVPGVNWIFSFLKKKDTPQPK